MLRRSPLLAVLLLTVSLAFGKGRERPGARFLDVEQTSPRTVALALLVRDAASRPVDLSLEARVKGRRGWLPVTLLEGPQALAALPSSPEGIEVTVHWDAAAALGPVYPGRVRFRATPLDPPGRKRTSKRLKLALFPEVEEEVLRGEILPDLLDNGRLDGVLLVDTRPAERYGRATLPGAISIPQVLKRKLRRKALPKDRAAPLVFFCEGVG